ncbi:MAG: TOBE domain-containing protein, partial [Arenibacterium sp.]
HHADGLSELTTSGGSLFLPRIDLAPGSATRVRILAQDVILAREAPEGLSALNILPVDVLALREGSGPGVIVQMRCGDDRLLARITRRSADALSIKPGDRIHAVVKSVSVARTDVASA